MVPTKEKSTSRSNLSQKAGSKGFAKDRSYNPNRVKSSIPKQIRAKQDNLHRSVKYLEEMQKNEVERSVKMHHEEKLTKEIFQRLRDNPNSELHDLQTEVKMLNRKVEPLLQRVE